MAEKENQCDGMCEECDKRKFCIFAQAEKVKTGYSHHPDDDKLNERLSKITGYRERYNPENNSSYSNPFRNYSSQDKNQNYSSQNRDQNYSGFRGEYNNSSGFHGSYDKNGGGDYSKMMPKAQKSNYCVGGK